MNNKNFKDLKKKRETQGRFFDSKSGNPDIDKKN